MAITIPSGQPHVLPYTLAKPGMAAQPLATAMAATNFLWKFYRPPVIDACPSQSFTASGTLQRYVTPTPFGALGPTATTPEHDYVATVETDAAATVTLNVEYAQTWVSIGGTTWTSIGSDSGSINGVGTLVVSGVAMPTNARALRWRFTCSTGNYTVHHLLAYPNDDTITTTGKQGGFVAYDDGLLEFAGSAPVNTEMLNRISQNCLVLRQTRPHAAISYVQPESSTYGQEPTAVSANTTHVLARARIWMGTRPTATLTVDCIGASTGGTLTVRQVASAEGYVKTESTSALALDGAIRSDSIVLTAQGQGVLRYADVEVIIYGGTSGSALLYSLHGWLLGE